MLLKDIKALIKAARECGLSSFEMGCGDERIKFSFIGPDLHEGHGGKPSPCPPKSSVLHNNPAINFQTRVDP